MDCGYARCASGRRPAVRPRCGATNYRADYTALAVSMLARWSQENFYQNTRQHYNLDRLAEYGTEPVPDLIQAVHPAGCKLDSQIRAQTETRRRQLVLFGALGQAPLTWLCTTSLTWVCSTTLFLRHKKLAVAAGRGLPMPAPHKKLAASLSTLRSFRRGHF